MLPGGGAILYLYGKHYRNAVHDGDAKWLKGLGRSKFEPSLFGMVGIRN